MRILMMVLLMLALFSGGSAAQTKKSPPVETLALKSQEEYKGFRLAQTRAGTVLFVVERSWLKKNQPARFELFSGKEKARDDAILLDYQRRIDLWIDAEQVNQKPMAWLDALKSEKKILGENKPSSQLMVLEFKNSEVRKYTPLPPVYKQLLLAALQEKIENIPGRSAQEIDNELKERKVDWLQEKIALTDRLPRFGVEDEADWLKRKALFAYSREQGLHLQGSGDFLVDGRENQKVDLMGLIQRLGQNALGDLFKDLQLGAANKGPSWQEQAANMAGAKKMDGIRVTRVLPELPQGRMTVEDAFFARLPAGNLLPVWSQKLSASIALPRPRAEGQIRSDPRLGEILKQAEKLGLATQVEQAIKAGAATLELQSQADQAFNTFLRDATRRLDGPPIPGSAK